MPPIERPLSFATSALGLRQLLRSAVFLLLTGWVVACSSDEGRESAEAPLPPPASKDSRPPDVLLISIDTLRADHLSSYGYSRSTSPFMDELAAQGLRFENAYSHSPFTLTSHMSIFTSMVPTVHGVDKQTGPLHPSARTLATFFQDADYETHGFFGAKKWLAGEWGFDRGFSTWEFHRDVDAALENSGRRLATADQQRPLFVFLHLMDVHCSNLKQHGSGLYPAPGPYDEMFLPYPEVDHRRHLGQDIYFNEVELSDEERANVIASYDGGIRHVDDALRQFFDRWDRTRGLDRTIVCLTSDHGEALGEHGTFDGHGGLYQEGSHVPLIFRFPDEVSSPPAGTALTETVRLIDVAPTLLSAAGLWPDVRLHGEDLLSIRRDRPVFAEDSPVKGQRSRALKRGSYRLIRPRGSDLALLFDLADDPEEAHSRVEALPELALSLSEQLELGIARDQEAGASFQQDGVAPLEYTDKERAELEALGYLLDH